MRLIRGSVGFSIALALVLAGPLSSQTPAPAKQGAVERIKVHGKALEGNLEGDSPDRDVFVYLPPGYADNPSQRYPVVYLLHGYGLTAERWMTFANIAAAADRGIAAGITKEMILVNPDAFTKYNGSMYSSSPTIGDWETFIAEDLVSYIDSHYRTIPNRMSRGLGGHSMGGYGTMRIGMKRPDVFSSLYPMSSCCLLNSPGAQGNRGAGARGEGRGGRGGAFANAQSAQAAAWASNPNNPPQYFDLPIKDGQPQPLVIAKFAANSPLAMIDQYLTNLKKYQAIMIDVGTEDGLAASNRQMSQILMDFGVAHTFETYEGNHTNRVAERMETKVLPFFSKHLSR